MFPEESSCNFGLFSEFISPYLVFNIRFKFKNSSLPGSDGTNQGCGEIKAIMAFSFLLWLLRSSFSSRVYANP
jgi:hypothetical protein